MPSEERRAEVGSAEDIETTTEDHSGDAGEDGAIPCYLRLVDGKMGGCGPVAALLLENGISGRVFDSLGCGGSKRGRSAGM